ncbi:MAG: histidine phosphatase family protein [Kiritimatiellia bacterium]
MEIDLDEVKNLLRAGNRVLLMMRHAERPPIDHDDPTFGAHLPLTPRGERMAEWVGARLKEFAGCVQFLASPLCRTRLTAACVARGMELADPDIPTAAPLGNSTFYFADQSAVFNLFRDGSFYEKVFAYIEKGTQTGFNEIHRASDELETWALARFTGRLGVFTTHDLYNGAFLAARGVVKSFTVETWIQFLDSAAIVVAPDGTRRYALVRSHADAAVPRRPIASARGVC